MKHKKKTLGILLIVLLILFAVFSVISFIFIKINFDNNFRKTERKEYSSYLRYEDVKERYDRELLSFQSGKNQLQGYLYGAENKKGLIVISHGIGGGAENYLAETLYFVDHGYQVFSYDNTGCYESEGKNSVGLSQSVIDLDAALSYIEKQVRFEGIPIFLYGHSWGGYAVTAIFNYNHKITASVSVAGFNKPISMILEWGKGMIGNFAYIEYPYICIYQTLLFGKNANLSAVDGINSTDTPILIIHGNKDTTVGYEGAGTIAYRKEITNPNVQYKICDGEKQNDHNKLFESLDAIAYADEMNAVYENLCQQYNDKIPKEVEEEYYANIDKEKMSELDEKFMQDVLAFYEKAVVNEREGG